MTDNFALEELEGATAGEKRLLFMSRDIFGSRWKVRKLKRPVPLIDGVTRLAFRENVDASRVLSNQDRAS